MWYCYTIVKPTMNALLRIVACAAVKCCCYHAVWFVYSLLRLAYVHFPLGNTCVKQAMQTVYDASCMYTIARCTPQLFMQSSVLLWRVGCHCHPPILSTSLMTDVKVKLSLPSSLSAIVNSNDFSLLCAKEDNKPNLRR
jgi:hypothetical protein